MMKTANFWGLAALAAVMGFMVIMAGCDDGGGGHTHQWGEWEVTKAANCTETGSKTRVCTLNATHTETETLAIDSTVHDWVIDTVNVEKYPTCIEAGKGLMVCTYNHEHTKEDVIPIDPDAHDWETLTGTPATCTETGNGTRKCKACEKEENGTLAALGHNYQNWTQTTVPTFISEGVETEVCSHDNSHIGTQTRSIPALPITTTANWTTALSQLNGKTGEYTLTVSGDVGVAGVAYSNPNFGTTPDGSSLSVTLKGSGKLYLTSRGNIVRINANQTLIIDSEDLILEGLTNGQNGATQDNNDSVVRVAENGTLELKNGTISNNKTTKDPLNNVFGGGVGVVNSGTFIMNGGKIIGNSARVGGGVSNDGTFKMYGGEISDNLADWEPAPGTGGSSSNGGGVISTGIFIMYGGEISGNSANYGNAMGGSLGGGVCIQNGTFQMVTGIIYGSNESDDIKNTATNGSALGSESIGFAVVQYGTFTGDTWNGTDIPLTDGEDSFGMGPRYRYTNDTIRVINGVLQ